MGGILLLGALALSLFAIAFSLRRFLPFVGAISEVSYVISGVLAPALWLLFGVREADAFSRSGTELLLPFLVLLMTVPAWAGVYAAKPKDTDGFE